MACLEERKLLVKILKSKRFPQQDLIDADKFLTFALARGVSADVRLLEAFEKEGVFYPVVCCRAPLVRYIVDRQHPDGRPRARVPLTEGPAGEQETVDVPRAFWFSPRVLSALDNGLKVVWPGTGRFVPWAKQQDAMTRRPHLWRCYHPYQLLWFRRVVTRTTARERLVMREVDRRLLSPRAVRRARALEVLREEHPRHLRELALLVAAEDAYLPAVRRVVHLGTESYEEWDDWRGHRSPQALVDLVGYTVDEVTNLRHRAASNGSAIDPNANFDILLREVTRSELGHLRDDALAAWQYYEAADLLGSLLSDLTGEAQPETPELVHGPWLRVRMREDVGGNTDARQTVLRYYGLDPRVRVLWLVEGQTEFEFVQAYCAESGIELSAAGVRLEHTGGIRDKDRNVWAMVGHAQEEGAAVLFTIDRERRWREVVKRAEERGLPALALSDVGGPLLCGVLVWPSNFEDDNFGRGDLLSGWMDASAVGPRGSDLPRRGLLRRQFGDFCRSCSAPSPRESVEAFGDSIYWPYEKVDVGKALGMRIAKRRSAKPQGIRTKVEDILFDLLRLSANLTRGFVTYAKDGPRTVWTS